MKHLTIEDAARRLLSQETITILTHRRPDGDTVGSAVALCRGLRKLGRRAFILENPQFTPRYLPYLRGLTAVMPMGTVVSVDVASENQFPMGFSGTVVLAVDHHASNTGFAEETLLDGGRASCGEIIFDLLQLMEVPRDKALADALYIAVSTDTGCFRYSNTRPDTLRTAASLMEWGADTVSLNLLLFERKSKARMELEAYLAQHMEVYAGGKVAVCILPESEKKSLGATEDDADAIAGFPRNLEGAEIGVLLRDLPGNQCKISLRTDSRRYDASKLCRELGGGGHCAAAGATVSGSLTEGRTVILNTIARVTGLAI